MADQHNWYTDEQPDPFRSTTPQTVSRNRGSRWLWIIGGGGFVSLLMCGGCTWGVVHLAGKIGAQDIQNQLGDHPIVQEHVGHPAEVTMNWSDTIIHENDDVFVYDIAGPKGSGQLYVEEGNLDAPVDILSAELIMSDGTRLDLLLGAVDPVDAELPEEPELPEQR